MDTDSSCQSCGQSITKEDLGEGLAVRVDGRLVCSSCVDQLPGEAQVRINQLRALRGLEATTYRMPRTAHPKLAAFTFTTSMNVHFHRRELAATGTFDAPVLPDAGIAKLVQPIPPQPTTSIHRPPMSLLFGGIAALIAVAVGITLAVRASGDSTPAPKTVPAGEDRTTSGPGGKAPMAFEKIRTNYPSGALAAWQEASIDPRCPTKVLQVIAGELVQRHAKYLAGVERTLQDGDYSSAAEAMTAIDPLPDHLLFRSARQQSTDLEERIRLARIAATAPAPAPAPVIEPPPPAVKPPDPVVVQEVKPVPPPEPAPVAEPAVAVGDCFLFAAEKLGELPGRKDWKRRGSDTLALSGESGSLIGNLSVQGGTYQLWIKARTTTASTVQVIIAGQRSQQLKLPNKTEWIRVEPANFTLPAGAIKIQFVALGSGAQLNDVYLADALRTEPEKAIADTLFTVPAIATTAAPIEPVAVRAPWTPRFAEPHPTLDPAVEAHRVPSGLPGNSGSVLESTKGKTGGRHGFTVEFTSADVQGGGLAILISPRRPDRTTVAVSALDGEGRRIPLDSLVLDSAPWQIHTIDLSRIPGAQQVLLEDIAQLSTGFLLAKIAAIAGAAPTAELLDLRPPALLPITVKNLDAALNALTFRRKSPAWRKEFNPALVKVLIGQKLTIGSWETDVRKRLQEVLGIAKLPNKTIETLVMNDQWLNNLIKPVSGQTPVLDPAKHHLVIICTAGIEFPTGLDERQAFINFWKKLVDELLNRGVLPVPVLGPSKVDGDDKPAVEKLWKDLAAWLAESHPGVPVIDLRPAAAVSADRFAPGGAKLSVELLGEGYADLLHRFEILRKSGR